MEPGQLVTCIGNDPLYYKLLLWAPVHCPQRGLVYTIGSVTTNCKDCGEDHITVEEINSPFITGYPLRWFKPCREVDFDLFIARLLPFNPEQKVEG